MGIQLRPHRFSLAARDLRSVTRVTAAVACGVHCPLDPSKALEREDFAIAEFRDMKMQPSLERALRHKEILRA